MGTLAPVIDDLAMVEELWDDAIPCQGLTHSQGLFGHVAIDEATWRLSNKCCGYRVSLCAGRVAVLKRRDILHCSMCGRDSSIFDWSFTEL